MNLPRVTTPPGKRYAFGSLVNIPTESYLDPLARPSGVESGQRRSPKKNLDEIPPSWTERLSRPRVVSPPRVQASESPILKVHNEFLSTMRSGSMNVSPRGNSNRQRFEVEKSPFVADVVAFKSSPNGKPPLTIREFFQRSGAVSTRDDHVSTRDDHVTPDTINNRVLPPPGAEELFESALVKAIETAMNKHKGT